MINDVIKERRKRLVFELDFKKTYDRVNWDFLDIVLQQKGFWGEVAKLDKGLFS